MSQETTEADDSAEYLKSDLARAVESNNPDSIQNLNKNETVFYLCSLLGVEPPEAHPSEHNGTVPRSLAQNWARVVGDYAERNGTDAFHADDVIGEEDGEEEGEEEEEEGEEEEADGEESDD